ncbi:LacI family transcriptional regulator [Opitutaceae bacterium TAV4]|uniref:LacI family DNA-binding transcriptional regulator n=1 Tax=Geminisphaera colitermitum TaxID=1148786 RepID=UPI000158D34A|nr:LacI family DNA-binding transcriptional regulator [Geminisphaera colitermitum]RRJ94663.1 LacI family transcriptional regulator [Opitutaceae bacterium TAV4]RRJ98730.1 LacI family transcriptional regulator [Opitutaceae bacterium TAV3]
MPKKNPVVRSTAELADHLGLSRWTVSHGLNDRPWVKEETRRLIQDTAKALGFTPNPLARGLQNGRTGMIGVCFNELENPIIVKKISILQRLLLERGYQGLIELTLGNPEIEQRVIQHFLGIRVEGIVTVNSRFDPAKLLAAAGAKIPLAHIDPYDESLLPHVRMDRAAAMELLVLHAASLGHRRFALLGMPENEFGERWRGLHAGFAKAGINEGRDVRSINRGDPNPPDYEHGRALAADLLESDFVPTVILAVNDRVAIGAMNCLTEAGWQIPQKCSVTGFDNLDIGNHWRPRITTIDHQTEDLLVRGIELLFRRINRPRSAANYVETIPPSLVTRESTQVAIN